MIYIYIYVYNDIYIYSLKPHIFLVKTPPLPAPRPGAAPWEPRTPGSKAMDST